MNYQEIFTPVNKKTKMVIATIIIAVVFCIAWRLIEIGFDMSAFFSFGTESANLFSTVVISTLTSLLGTILFTLYYESLEARHSQQALEKIRSIAKKELLISTFDDLSYYKGLYLHDHVVSIEMLPTSEGRYYIARMKYKYRSPVNRGQLVFKIYRVNPSFPKDKYPSLYTDSLTSQVTWYADESHIPDVFDSSDYKLEKLIVNNSPIEIRKQISDDKMLIEFSADLSAIQSEDLIIKFELSVPIELESYLHITYDLPTEDVSVSFDYRKVQDRVIVSAIDKVGLRESPLETQDDVEGFVNFDHKGWAYPKDSYIFMWWKK